MMAAGDQAIVVGYAEGNRFGSIPAASFIAKRTAIELGTRRRSGEFSFLRPDGKVLACIRCANEVPTHADRIVISVQHDTNYDRAEICSAIKAMCQQLWGNEPWYDDHTIIEINPPNGAFCFGGPQADAGVTGRKLVAEAYGPKVPHGGGALSGKDPTKIDRCGAYAARWVAKSLVASGVAQAVIVRLTYVIGTYAPVQIDVRALDPHNSLDEQLVDLVRAEFDLRPGAIIERLGLSRPIYRNATLSAHYGIDPELPWEVARTDLMKFRSRTVREVAASALFTEQHQPSQDAVRCLDAVPHRWT
jgi:S-adenosylmethionine synthetase